eukprot:1121403_1
MALSRMARVTMKHLSHPIRQLAQPSALYMSYRLKTYLVGVDGSGFGYSALRATSQEANSGDQIIAMYFPPNLELMAIQPTTIQAISQEIYDAQHAQTKLIEAKCKDVVHKFTPKDRDITFEMHVGEHSFSAKDDLVKECYKTKADVLVMGARGLAHSLKEKISDKVFRVGHTTDWCVAHAPCDVMIVKVDHEY